MNDIFQDNIIMTVKELKTILDKYKDTDRIYLLGLDDNEADLYIENDLIAETY